MYILILHWLAIATLAAAQPQHVAAEQGAHVLHRRSPASPSTGSSLPPSMQISGQSRTGTRMQSTGTQTTGQTSSMSRPSTPYAPLKDFKLIRNTNLNAPTVNSYFVYFILLGQASGNPLILPCPAMIPVSGTEANRELAGSCRGLTFTINLGDGTVMVRMQQ